MRCSQTSTRGRRPSVVLPRRSCRLRARPVRRRRADPRRRDPDDPRQLRRRRRSPPRRVRLLLRHRAGEVGRRGVVRVHRRGARRRGPRLARCAPRPIRARSRRRRTLLVHGSPRKINEYLLPDRPDKQLARLADEADADLVCVGHIHIPYHRVVAGGDGRPVHYVSRARRASRRTATRGRAGSSWLWAPATGRPSCTGSPYDIEAVVAAMREGWKGLPPRRSGDALRRRRSRARLTTPAGRRSSASTASRTRCCRGCAACTGTASAWRRCSG